MQSVLNEDFADVFQQFGQYTVDKATEKRKTGKSYYIGGSISKYTKALIMSFPVLCDDSLAMDSLMNINKANERNITSMMEMLFASMSINGKQGMTGRDVVRLFHKDIDTMPIDDLIDYSNDFAKSYGESAKGENLPVVTDAMLREAANSMVYELKKPQKSFPINSLNESSVDQYITTFDGRKVNVLEANNEPSQLDYNKFAHQKAQDEIRNQQSDDRATLDNNKFTYQQKQDVLNQKIADDKARLDLNKKRALDADYKKANELQPTMLVVNFNTLAEDGKTILDRSSFITGVKCRLVPTSPMDISERLASSQKNRRTFKDFIRATTGEIKFVRGFLFNVNQQKIDARNNAKKGEAARLWNTLKYRSNKNNYRRLSKDGNDASAITTLVVSQDTANYLKSVSKVDISLPNTARKIMEDFNLLCLVIADDANEVAKFIYDGNKNFDSLSYAVLSKEANDKALRRELNLINQARRY